MPVFVKFAGVEGESADSGHDKWIDVLAIDWGSSKPGSGAPNPANVALFSGGRG